MDRREIDAATTPDPAPVSKIMRQLHLRIFYSFLRRRWLHWF